MLKVKASSTEAFAALHGRYQQKVLAYFYGLSGDSAAANDLAQETFLRVWQVRERYRATGPFPAYLFAISRLIWQEYCRREGKQWRLGHKVSLETGEEQESGSHNSPFRQAARSEMAHLLFHALEQLPEEQRQVFMLRHVRGLSLEEIAGALDCPVNTVRSRKILAIKKLRHLLERDYGTAVHLAKESSYGMQADTESAGRVSGRRLAASGAAVRGGAPGEVQRLPSDPARSSGI
jgi:RNA polymerase sigma-70 factor (ECF subfamily)